jgi:hypothetical protein
MYPKRACGVLALTLVALHLSLVTNSASSELIVPRHDGYDAKLRRILNSDKHFPGMLSKLQDELGLVWPEAGKEMTTRDDETSSDPFSDWTKLVDSPQFVELNCNETLIERAQNLRDRYLQNMRSGYMGRAIAPLLESCYSKLDKQIGHELGSLSESVRQHLKLFVEGDNSGRDTYSNQHLVVVMLTKLISAPPSRDEIQSKGELNFLGACKEMTDRFAHLKPIRSEREALTRRMTSHLPHVSFYDFCRHLVDSGITRDTDSFLRLNPRLKQFFTVLDCLHNCSIDQTISSLVAARHATRYTLAIKLTSYYDLREARASPAVDLKLACSTVGDLIQKWLIRLNTLARAHGKPPSEQSEEIERYSRYWHACQRINNLAYSEIKAHGLPEYQKSHLDREFRFNIKYVYRRKQIHRALDKCLR